MSWDQLERPVKGPGLCVIILSFIQVMRGFSKLSMPNVQKGCGRLVCFGKGKPRLSVSADWKCVCLGWYLSSGCLSECSRTTCSSVIVKRVVTTKSVLDVLYTRHTDIPLNHHNLLHCSELLKLTFPPPLLFVFVNKTGCWKATFFVSSSKVQVCSQTTT